MFQFPANPTVGQIFTPIAGTSYKWDGFGWVPLTATAIPDAPADGQAYIRQNGAWVVVPTGVPAGTIVDYGGTSAPSGWYSCDGTLRPVSGDPALFAAIGYTHGGSGANFAVPDARGRTTAMADGGTNRLAAVNAGYNNVGFSGGDQWLQTHNHPVAGSGTTGDDSPDHTHPGIATNSGAQVAVAGGSGVFGVNAAAGSTGGASNRHQHPFNFSVTSANAGQGFGQNIQPTLITIKIIKR